MAKKNKFNVEEVCMVLVLVGALNWGLSAFGFNLVDMLLGAVAGGFLAQVVYVAVALSGVYLAYERYLAK